MKNIKICVAVCISSMFVILIHGAIDLKMVCQQNKENILGFDEIRNIVMSDEEIDKIYLTDITNNDVTYISGINKGILKNVVYKKIYVFLF